MAPKAPLKPNAQTPKVNQSAAPARQSQAVRPAAPTAGSTTGPAAYPPAPPTLAAAMPRNQSLQQKLKAARDQKNAEEAKKKAEDEARKKAENEARKKAEDEARKKAEDEARKKEAEEDSEKRRQLADALFGIDDHVFDEELIVPHEGKSRDGIEYTKKLPDNFKFKDAGYEPTMKLVTEEYRGTDHPRWAAQDVKKHSVLLTFAHDDNDLLFEKEDTMLQSFGALHKNSPTDCIGQKIHLDTQYPSMELVITRHDKTSVSWRVFPNSMVAVQGIASLQYAAGEKLNAEWVDAECPEAADCYFKGNMAQTILNLSPEGSDNPSPNLVARRPIWTGDLSLQQILTVVDDYKQAIANGTLGTFPYADAVIAKLHIARWVAISRQMDNKIRESWMKTMQFYELCLNMCVRYGNLWFYTKSLNIKNGENILNRPQLMVDAPVPRWLVTEWAVKRDDSGDIAEVVPSRWAQFRHPGVFPDKHTAASAHALALARGVDSITKTIQERLDKDANNINAVFEDYWGVPGKYSVQVVCNLQDSLLTGQSLIPEAGTPISIEFRDSDNKLWRYQGTVVPTIQNAAEVTFSAIVHTPQGITEYYDFGDNPVVMVSIKLKQDNLSIGRQYVAFQQSALGPQREPGQGGPDFLRVLLGAPPQDPSLSTNPWVDSLTEAERNDFMHIMEQQRGSNSGQAQVAKLLLTDENGTCVVIAPPGTGKTKTGGDLITTIYEVMQKRNKDGETGVQHPLLICAPSNLAVDEILRKLIARDPTLGGMNAIRFRGARTRAPKDAARETQQEKENRHLSDDWWDAMEYMAGNDMIETDFGDFEYVTNFSKAIRKWAETWITGSQHPLVKQARSYLGLQEELMTNTKANKAELRKELEGLEAILQREYFKGIAAAFVTFNSALHPALYEYFKAKGLLADEAAMGILGDYLTALAANWDSLEHAIFIGDPNQQKGRAMAPKRNEFGRLQAHSFMQKVQDEAGKHIHYVQLTEQWRMDPQISGPVNATFYKGTMTDHPSTKLPQDVRQTVVSYFRKTMGVAYKDWHRFAIATDHSERNKSETFMKTTSSYNVGEAEYITKMIKGLLNHEPPKDGRKVEPRDILVTTPYSGMATHLWFCCKQLGIFGEGENQIRIQTGAATQGQEGKIQFLSFTINNENGLDKLQFLGERHQLNVMASRAQYVQIAVGNFLPWMRAVKKGESSSFTDKRSSLYHFGQFIGTYWKDDDVNNCTIIDYNDAYNALWRNKPSTKANAFAGRITVAPKRKNLDGSSSAVQDGNYGRQPQGGPASKKPKGNQTKPPKNMSSEYYINNLSKPMTTEVKKSLDDLGHRLTDVALMASDYLAKERSDINKSGMSAELKKVFNLRVQEAYQKRVSASLAAGMAKLNTGPDTLEQNLTKLASFGLDMGKRNTFLQSLQPEMRERVLDARDKSTRRKLDEPVTDGDDIIDWGDQPPDEPMDES
jgi:hypothetical protein